MKDKTGNEIHTGDYIVYGHALGRCAGLRFGKVLDVVEEEDVPPIPALSFLDDKRKKPGIYIIGLDDDWNPRSPQLLSKSSKLYFPDRVVVLRDGQLQKEYKDLLDSFVEKKKN